MKYIIKRGCKFRQESFGCILRVPIEIVLKTGQTYYKLNHVGYLVLDGCRNNKSIEDVVSLIALEYDVDKDDVRSDVIDLLNDLTAIGAVKEDSDGDI